MIAEGAGVQLELGGHAGSGEETAVSGTTVGVYLVRNTDAPPRG
jgi:hypothetical protein